MKFELGRRLLARCQIAVWNIDQFTADFHRLGPAGTVVTRQHYLDVPFWLFANLAGLQPIWRGAAE